MITGDNKMTASNIATDCNIYNPDSDDLCLEGYEFYDKIEGIICKNCK